MKKIVLSIAIIAFSATFNFSLAQDPTILYGGIRSSNSLVEIDTTGAVFTITGSTAMTTDAGTVSGTFGLAMHPVTEEMYILYDNGNDECDRHLGIVNLLTGAITDIGNAGNLVEIDFGSDGTLYGSTGSSCAPSYTLVEVNILTAATTDLFDFAAGSYGSSIGYNSFTDEMIYINEGDISSVNLGTLVETAGVATSHPGETHAIVVLTETLAWITDYEELHTFNPITGEFSFVEDLTDDFHALSFGPPACLALELEVTSYSVCIGGEVTLDATSPSGAEITWDGGVIDGVAFEPLEIGTFTYTATSGVDGECDLSVEVEVLGLPIVIPGAGDEMFCEDESIVLSAAGDADTYSWDPLDFTPGVGVHTYTLTGAHDAGCISTATIDITVFALPEITATVDIDEICVGNEIILTAGGGETYVWSDMDIIDGEPYTTTSVGTNVFTVTGADIHGCTNTATVEVDVVPEISITGTTTDEVAGADGAIDITIAGGVVAYLIDWDNDELDDFDDPADITGLVGGTYTVVIKGSTGCETTAQFVVNSELGIVTNNLNGVTIYPNPTIENITVELEGLFMYEIISVNGAVLLTGNGTNLKTISLKDFSKGVYFLSIESLNGNKTIKLIKN